VCEVEVPAEPVRLRVLVAGPSARTQGGMATVQRLLETWTPSDVELHVFATYVEGSALVRLRATLLGVGGALLRLLSGRIDVAHVHLSKRSSVLRKGLIVTVARALGVSTVVHAHAGPFAAWFDHLPRPAQALVRWLLVADRLVVLGEADLQAYGTRLRAAPERMLVMPNPVEWPEVVPERDSGGPVVAAFLGWLDASKGVFDLIQAVGRLDDEHRRRLRLVVAGHGDDDVVRTAVRDAGCADVVEVSRYLSTVERDALLGRAQLLVLPSYAEGLPMSVLEAMAWGVVPVVTPVGTLPTLITDGHNGSVVPVGDPGALAVALDKLLADDDARRELGRRAREDVRRYAASPWAHRLADLWRSLP
jgi:glycosyltransferase involved in cell wall biosynthesis